MKLIQQTLRLSQTQYNKKHLEIISALLPTNLTGKEIEVLATFMSLDKSITEGDMFNTLARKRVRELLGQSHGGLGNHLKSMLDKSVLIKDEETNRLSMKEFLLPQDDIQGYQIKLVKQDETE